MSSEARLRSLSCLLAGLACSAGTAGLAAQLAPTVGQWVDWCLDPASLLTSTAEQLTLVLGASQPSMLAVCTHGLACTLAVDSPVQQAPTVGQWVDWCLDAASLLTSTAKQLALVPSKLQQSRQACGQHAHAMRVKPRAADTGQDPTSSPRPVARKIPASKAVASPGIHTGCRAAELLAVLLTDL